MAVYKTAILIIAISVEVLLLIVALYTIIIGMKSLRKHPKGEASLLFATLVFLIGLVLCEIIQPFIKGNVPLLISSFFEISFLLHLSLRIFETRKYQRISVFLLISCIPISIYTNTLEHTTFVTASYSSYLSLVSLTVCYMYFKQLKPKFLDSENSNEPLNQYILGIFFYNSLALIPAFSLTTFIMIAPNTETISTSIKNLSPFAVILSVHFLLTKLSFVILLIFLQKAIRWMNFKSLQTQ